MHNEGRRFFGESETLMYATNNQDIVRLVSELAQGQVQPLRTARRAMIRWALLHTDGNVSQAAQMLGTSRGTIYRYAQKSHAAQGAQVEGVGV